MGNKAAIKNFGKPQILHQAYQKGNVTNRFGKKLSLFAHVKDTTGGQPRSTALFQGIRDTP